MIAFMMSFSGSELPVGSVENPNALPGPLSQDTHAAVGEQITLNAANRTDPPTLQLVQDTVALAEAGRVGIVVKTVLGGEPRGYAYVRGGMFQSDRQGEQVSVDQLAALVAGESTLTFTVVPAGTQTRIGIDRDEDGYLDRDELDACSDPADAASGPGAVVITGDFDRDGRLSIIDAAWFVGCMAGPATAVNDRCRCTFDFGAHHTVDLTGFAEFQLLFGK